jgi:hypothetical protein
MTPGYVVTVTESREAYERRRASDPEAYRQQGISRQEVDTLEEAREQAKNHADNLPVHVKAGSCYAAIDALGVGGGEIPLPDGSTITVKPAEDGGDR